MYTYDSIWPKVTRGVHLWFSPSTPGRDSKTSTSNRTFTHTKNTNAGITYTRMIVWQQRHTTIHPGDEEETETRWAHHNKIIPFFLLFFIYSRSMQLHRMSNFTSILVSKIWRCYEIWLPRTRELGYRITVYTVTLTSNFHKRGIPMLVIGVKRTVYTNLYRRYVYSKKPNSV